MRVPKIGDAGFAIVLTITDADGDAVDISTATTRQYVIEKPDGTVVTKTAAFATDGTDGKLSWTVEAGFLDQAGTYLIEAVVSGGDLVQRTSTRYSVQVGGVLA